MNGPPLSHHLTADEEVSEQTDEPRHCDVLQKDAHERKVVAHLPVATELAILQAILLSPTPLRRRRSCYSPANRGRVTGVGGRPSTYQAKGACATAAGPRPHHLSLSYRRTKGWEWSFDLCKAQQLSQPALEPGKAGAGELAQAPVAGVGLLGRFFSSGVGASCASRQPVSVHQYIASVMMSTR